MFAILNATLSELLPKTFMKEYAFSIIVLAIGFATGALAYGIVLFLLRRWQEFPVLQDFRIKTAYMEKPLRSLLPAIFVMASSPFGRIPEDAGIVVSHILRLWVIGSCGWFVIGLVRTVWDGFLSRYDMNAKDNLQARRIYTQVHVIENIVIAVVVFATISFMLMSFETVRQIGAGLIASAGIMGIVLGFAAQKTLGNFIAGIQIALTQPIRIDDVVIVENEWGWIEEITLTYVVVRIWDLRRLVVPISYFIEKPFQNWTRVSADILGSVYIYADYTVSVGELREELTRILSKSPHWDGKVNGLQVTGTTDRTVEIRALMSAATSPQAWDLRCEVRENFWNTFKSIALRRCRVPVLN